MQSIFDNTIANMTWKELENLGNKDVTVLFPLGVIEEHGPHLPLGTDIYFSVAVCRKIQHEIEQVGGTCLIAPPYYWGINHCTGAFPGSFSLKENTLKLVLLDIFENLKQFGFTRIYCVNQHGDPVHMKTILQAVKEANQTYEMQIKMLMEPYDVTEYGLKGDEQELLVDYAEYPKELFEPVEERLDIHAGAFETAAMHFFYEHMVNEKVVNNLPDYSLDYTTIMRWNEGGESARQVVPLGYAGNPSNYKKQLQNVYNVFNILCKYVADEIMKQRKECSEQYQKGSSND